MKQYSLKEVKEIIDNQEITKKNLPAYGITTARFIMQFFNPLEDEKEYKEAYNYLFSRFKKLEV